MAMDMRRKSRLSFGYVLGSQKVGWVRSPWWDGFWLLSGLPFGLVFSGLSAWWEPGVLLLWIVLVAQTGHTLAPMALAWGHRGFRAMMLSHPWRYIALPVAILVISTIIGAIAGRHLPNLRFDPSRFALAAGPGSWAELKNPFMTLVVIYAGWNAYHFGKQAFGVLSLYRRKVAPTPQQSLQRQIDKFYCCTVVWAAMGMSFIPQIAHYLHNLSGWPAHPHPFLDRVAMGYFVAGIALPIGMLVREWFSVRSFPRAIFILSDGVALALVFHIGLWGFALIGLNHWLVAIGLAAHVDANANRRSPWWFAGVVMAVGFVLFCWLFVNIEKAWVDGLTAAALTFAAGTVSFRLGLGFVHFLYDRWLYKGSSPIWSKETSVTKHVGVVGDGSLSWSRR